MNPHKTVAILGCGPAGLLAAHAATLLGHSVVIISQKHKSPMLGAQYMHRSIPKLDLDQPVKLSYVLHGEISDYRSKVYGDDADESLTVSPELFVGFHEAWSIRQAYNLLWKKYSDKILDTKIDQDFLLHTMDAFDRIISTIPAQTLCYQPQAHYFSGVKIWVDMTWHGDVPELNKQRYNTEHVVICNGNKLDPDHPRETGWYRTSTIYGHANTEWTNESIQTFRPMGVKSITKPLMTNCDCWPQVIRAGRYGLWRKGILSHEAFEMALEVL